MQLLQQIETVRKRRPRRVLLYGTHGIGKAQPLTAMVLTPEGFKTMREIKVGDQVVGADGNPTKVLGVYPQGIKDVYRVSFRDGSMTECCDDHLWFTVTFNERARGLSGAVRTLRDIRQSLRYGTQFNHAVPRVKPVEFEAKELPADPWLLGIYLGDGHGGSNVVITNSESDIQNRIRNTVAVDGDEGVLFNDIALRIKSADRTASRFKAALDALGLHGLPSEQKFVPSEYLHGSIEQRLETLRGLIDSDGFVTHPGSIEYTTVSPQLSRDFCFLVRSLGGSAKVSTKKGTYTKDGVKHVCQKVYRIFASFPDEITPVSSEKHIAKWGQPEWRILHTIRTVEHIGQKECQCLRVDALDSLYITDDFIVTHNSTFGATAVQPVFIQTEDGLGEIDCARFPLAKQLSDVVGAISALYSGQHDFQTLVVDSVDWLERLIWEDICRERHVDSIEDIGYAKGYTFALTQWRGLLEGLDALRNERGMTIILLAHARIERFENPETETYDRYVPRLHKLASQIIQEWCDEVLFATYKVYTKSSDEGFNRKKTKGVGSGERVLRTNERPAHVAKNRLNLPDELPLDWEAYQSFFCNPVSTQGGTEHA